MHKLIQTFVLHSLVAVCIIIILLIGSTKSSRVLFISLAFHSFLEITFSLASVENQLNFLIKYLEYLKSIINLLSHTLTQTIMHLKF